MSGSNTFLVKRFEQRLSIIRNLLQQGNKAGAEQEIKQLNDWINTFKTPAISPIDLSTIASLQLRLRRFCVSHGISMSSATGIPDPEVDESVRRLKNAFRFQKLM